MKESSQFIPYSQRELTLVRRAGKLKADAAELGLKGREIKKIKGRKRRKKNLGTLSHTPTARQP